jgi:DNA-binding FadR family transcriptional regulator
MALQKHETVIKKLLLDIFNNKLKAGVKMPTERQLSATLGVDRTSLRMALKQLESMQVLDIRQGDGIYVKEYRKYAGVDFLRTLFFQQEDVKEEIVLDGYLVGEVCSFWAEFMPLMIRMSLGRMTHMEMKRYIDIFDEELENLDDKAKIVELEILTQDMVAESSGNLLMLLISNSTRQLRTKIVRLFVDSIDTESVREHVTFKRALMNGYLVGEITDPDVFANEHKKVLSMYQELLKGTWTISEKERAMVRNVLLSGTE